MARRRTRLALAAVVVLALVPSAARAGKNDRRSVAAKDARPTVLLVLAHPDDETMAGGLMGRFLERGFRVVTTVVTNGENGKVVLEIPRTGDLVEADPGQPGTGTIRTPADLARSRQREHLAAQARNGVEATYFLSDPDRADYKDDWDGGVTTWDRPRLTRSLRQIAEEVEPDVVITTNPDEGGHNHPQHRGIGDIVREVHREGGFDRGGESPSLYGMREHDWYTASQTPQEGDVHFPREERSRALGKSYLAHLRGAAAQYRTQSAQPNAMAARVRVGVVPGYQPTDLLKRLDGGGHAVSVEALLAAWPAPSRRLPGTGRSSAVRVRVLGPKKLPARRVPKARR